MFASLWKNRATAGLLLLLSALVFGGRLGSTDEESCLGARIIKDSGMAYFCLLSARAFTDINSVRNIQSAGLTPLAFERNSGQGDPQFEYLSRGANAGIYLSKGTATLDLGEPRSVVRAAFTGSNPNPEAVTEDPLDGRVNYFYGNDRAKWITDIATYRRVRYRNIYPGIDVVYYGAAGVLEHDMIVQPGADPAAIRMEFRGADRVTIAETGAASVHFNGRHVEWKKPVLYQDIQGERVQVEGRYLVTREGGLAFEVGRYDPKHPLVIDPVVSYASYQGSSFAEGGVRVAVDGQGNSYVAGITHDHNFPVSTGAYANSALPGPVHGYIVKYNAATSAVVYSTYIAGSSFDGFMGLAVDAAGNAYLAGVSDSNNYPVTSGVIKSKFNSVGPPEDPSDCVVTKLNPAGNALVYSTYLGGAGPDFCTGIAIDTQGNAYLTGTTTEQGGFPRTDTAAYRLLRGKSDAFIVKINPTATAVVYGTFLGGADVDSAQAIAVDAQGAAYITGQTASSDLPVTTGALQRTYAAGVSQPAARFGDAFVAKLNPAGTAFQYVTFLGGRGEDIGFGIAVDAQGSAYVTGSTISADLPATAGVVQRNYKGLGGNTLLPGGDAFVAKVNATGTALGFLTYLGGTKDDWGTSIALDASGNIWLAGATMSPDFPVSADAAQKTYKGSSPLAGFPTGDAWVAELNPTATTVLYSTYLGGSGDDYALGVAVDSGGNVYTTGSTLSGDFPLSASALQKQYAGSDFQVLPIGDSFLVKVTPGSPSPANVSIQVSAQTASGGNPRRGETFTYSIKVTNTGSAAAAGVTIQDTADGRAELALTGPTTFTVGTLAPGASQTMTVQGSASAAGTFSNSATVSWTDASGKTATAVAATSTTVGPAAGDLAATVTGPVALRTGVQQVLADGATVYAVNNPGDSLTVVNCAGGACSVTSTVSLGSGAKPVAAALEDVDGDGQKDVLVLNQGAGTLTAILSGSPGAPVVSSVGAGPVALAPLTVGDGVPRVAVAFAGSVTVFGWDGGQFQPGASQALGSAAVAMVNADFNGDGTEDLLVATAAGTAQVLLGDGGGGVNLTSEVTVGAGPAGLAAGDLNGDGVPDAAVTTGAGLVVLLNDGAGNLTAQAAIAVRGAGAVLMADFNGDGLPDVAVAGSTGASVSLFRGDGTGGLAAAGSYMTGRLPVSLAQSDFDGDGKADLVTGNSGSQDLTVLLFPGG